MLKKRKGIMTMKKLSEEETQRVESAAKLIELVPARKRPGSF